MSITFAPSKLGRLKELTVILGTEEDSIMTFFEACPNLLCVLDENRNIILINNACQYMLGYEKSQMLSKNILDFIDQRDRQSTVKAMNNSNSRVTRFHNRCINASSELIPMEWDVVKSTNQVFASARTIPASCLQCSRLELQD